MKRLFLYKTEIGSLVIAEESGMISGVYFSEDVCRDGAEFTETPLLKKAAAQIIEYLEGKRKAFDFPITFSEGTDFQRKVWQALLEIPYGETRSYKDIAVSVGNPKASRAVGRANNRNPLSILVPCHRVIGADGSLAGYGGGLDKKIKLLEIERRHR